MLVTYFRLFLLSRVCLPPQRYYPLSGIVQHNTNKCLAVCYLCKHAKVTWEMTLGET